MIGPLTYLDAALIAVCFISALLAMYRGLSREMLSIVSWIIAGAAALYFVIYHRDLAEDVARQVGSSVTTDGGAQGSTAVAVAQFAIALLIFLIVLIVIQLITARISDAIVDSSVGLVDRILGFLFGLARGFLLVVIPYVFYAQFNPDEANHPDWVRNGLSTPYIKSTGNSIRMAFETYMPSAPLQQQQAPAGPPAEPELPEP